MKASKMKKTLNIITVVLKWVLLLYNVLLFAFAWLSGAESATFTGFLKNFPNTLPWVILFIITWLTFRDTSRGAIMLIVYSALLAYFFGIVPSFSYEFLIFIFPFTAGIIIKSVFFS